MALRLVALVGMLSDSEEVKVLIVWFTEIWVDVLDIFLVILSVDGKVEQWVDVALGDGLVPQEETVPGIKHDWRLLWADPLFVLIVDLDGLDRSHDDLKLLLDEHLVSLILGHLLPVGLDLAHLGGVSNSSDILSEGDNLWDLVQSVVLHLLELVVLLVELVPGIIVDVDVNSRWLVIAIAFLFTFAIIVSVAFTLNVAFNGS